MNPNFNGLRVLSLESRRASEIAKLISNAGGLPVVAPAVREVPLESNAAALRFITEVASGSYDAAVFLTGVGFRLLLQIADGAGQRDAFISGLEKLTLVARGPKPVAALREAGLQQAVTAPEPNTWHELIAELDRSGIQISGKRVAIQEYGEPSGELIEALKQRGAVITAVPVYQWALPEDTRPVVEAIASITRGEIDVALFMATVQVQHLFKLAEQSGGAERLRAGLSRLVVASIGPTTSAELRSCGVEPDMEPSHPKMGFLVNEAAARSGDILKQKRARGEVA